MTPIDVEAAVRQRIADGLLVRVDRERRRDVLRNAVHDHDPLIPTAALEDTVERLLARAGGLGPLAAPLADPAVTEIMVNGPGAIWTERRGELVAWEQASVDIADIEAIVERIVAPLGLRADRSAPMADARLPDGSRVNIVLPPLAIDGPYITIRKFRTERVRLDDFAPPGVVELLEWAVAARANVVVAGGTAAGKTTLLNALASRIDGPERIVTVEDAAELRLHGAHVVRLEARPPNAEGLGAITIRDLVRNALRMRPDRIVVGEVRGAEALDMLQAMNTGHDGSLSTCHANSTLDALARIETMVMMGPIGMPLAAIREQLDAALDLVVFVERSDRGARRVAEVCELTGDGQRLRSLAGPDGVTALPSPTARHGGGPAPDPAWIDR